MYTGVSAHTTLNSTEELHALVSTWTAHNKSRIYLQNQRETSPDGNASSSWLHPIAVYAPPPIASVLPVSHTITPSVSKTTPYVLASMRQVLESRRDLVDTSTVEDTISATKGDISGTNDRTGPSDPTDRNATNVTTATADTNIHHTNTCMAVHSRTPAAKQHAVAMANIETKLLAIVFDRLSCKTPPYNCTAIEPHRVDGLATHNDIVAHACFAHIRSVGTPVTRQVYIPIAAPSTSQLVNCAENPSYNKNMITNIAESLSRKDIQVVLCSGSPQTCNPDNLYFNIDTPVNAIGTMKCCEDLLFGDNRTTSSPGFCVGTDIGSVYAGAAHKYQKYSNVAVGDRVTLVPSSRQGTMQVVSMTCPQLGLSHIVTGVSGTRIHPKFGPNHTTRIVEVMNELAPFVKMCSERYMSIPTETVHELQEDDTIPVPKSTKIEHCFAHNAIHGVQAYVGTHSFSLATGILNTYTTTSPFPMNQDITVHVAAIHGGMSTGRI
jgi:hypothetical protein